VNRQPVDDSSLIKSIGYDAVERTMDVEFARGDVYRYYDVDQQFHTDFLAAKSKGAWFNSNKLGIAYERLGDEAATPIPEGELLSSDDAELWAKQFWLRWSHRLRDLDEDTMLSWFANYRQSVLTLQATKTVEGA
jgi:hypothetical protein